MVGHEFPNTNETKEPWNHFRLCQWARDLGFEDPVKWVNSSFIIENDGSLRCPYDLVLFEKMKLTELPPNLKIVEGDLILTDCENLATLPHGLRVQGALVLEGCIRLANLPEDLDVEQDIVVPAHLAGATEYLKQAGHVRGDIRFYDNTTS